jgi:hypothetical protein
MWSPFSTRRRQASRRRRVSSKLHLESLEDRCTPSAFAVSAAAPDLSGHLLGSGQGVGTDAAGNVYTVGYVGGSLSTSDTDGFVRKYSADGVGLWTQTVQGIVQGTSLFDSADVIAVDAAGNSYVAGTFRGTLQLGNFTITSTGVLDVFVEKLDTNGNVLWLHQFANTGNFGPPTFQRLATCDPRSIAFDSAGEVVVAGAFSGHIDMDPANPGQHFLDYPAPGQSGHADGYLVKLHADGSFAWEAQVVNVPRDSVGMDAVAMDGSGNVYTVGTFANDNYFNDENADNSIQQNANSIYVPAPQGLANVNQLFLWKLTADGTNAFVRPITSVADTTDPFAGFTATSARASILCLGMAIDAQGNIYATGAFNDKSVDFYPGVSFPGNPTSGPNIVTSPYGNYDTFVEKMDSAGNWQWVRQISTITAGDNWGTGLALDPSGNPYITGYLTADSLVGNFLLTPASAAGNSYIAELSPQGQVLCAQKSVDSSSSGDRPAGMAVDSPGFVDIAGDFSTQMQWPGLPQLTNGNGGANTAIFTVKTQLTCTSVPSLQGTVLHLVDDPSNPIVITDDRGWGILVQVGQDPLRAYQGLTQIDYTGDGVVTVALRGLDTVALGGPDVMPPNLRFAFGNRNDSLNLMADFSAGNPFVSAPWRIDVATGGGIYNIDTNILGSVPVDLTTNSGPGTISDIYESHPVDQFMPLPSAFVFNGGPGVNNIKVLYYHPFFGFLGMPLAAPNKVSITGTGTTVADVEYYFQPSSPGSPDDPPAFIIPLSTTIRTTGDTTAHVGYHFMNAPGAANGIIAIHAPITLDIASRKAHSVQVDFADDVPAVGTTMPTLQMYSSLDFHVVGGDTGDDLSLQMGAAPLDPGTPVPEPELMPGSSVTARFAGGTADDTISEVFWFDPRSMGHVIARVMDGAGNNDLTLEIYGYVDPYFLNALISGAGQNTVHNTPNVRVINRDGGR